ncbi:LUD domain-containing protein [Cellulophaga sp. BC115SP]|uniref:LutC/YkgG family protein n=1 Tax=Cellulophaga sp. BC115SP TaxID=2683263 RepID=UPI00141300C3|nr:LUD domain-containing protein [Cellulophaga sp. BC115SP]NBB28964.1 lactate utilization protein B/C [Cellulophaga sp. BC115SP]
MSSRDKILAKIAQNQPEFSALPDLKGLGNVYESPAQQFKTILEGIGGKVIEFSDWSEIKAFVHEHFDSNARITSTLPELADIAELDWVDNDPHTLENVDFTIIRGHLGVAENSAIWITESLLKQRVSAFIPQYLAIVLEANSLVSSMHEAYTQIGMEEYGFATFLAGPSKTADIEQSLVLGAHGARGLTVFLKV